jgi:hypothetical protein
MGCTGAIRSDLLFPFEDFTLSSALGLPHRLMEDDVYKNMYIPKGSLARFTACPFNGVC